MVPRSKAMASPTVLGGTMGEASGFLANLFSKRQLVRKSHYRRRLPTEASRAVTSLSQWAPLAVDMEIPFNATGTVQFKDGTTVLGAPVPVTAGFAFLHTSALTTGTHTLTAVFTPTNPAAFGPSTSPPVRPLSSITVLGCCARPRLIPVILCAGP